MSDTIIPDIVLKDDYWHAWETCQGCSADSPGESGHYRDCPVAVETKTLFKIAAYLYHAATSTHDENMKQVAEDIYTMGADNFVKGVTR